jgi:hypothetical protein
MTLEGAEEQVRMLLSNEFRTATADFGRALAAVILVGIAGHYEGQGFVT